MKILITGAGGQLGRNLSKISHASHEVFALDRQALDISQLQDVERIIDEIEPTCVINTAAYTAVDKAETEPDLAMKVNRDGPENLAKVCAKLDIPFIHVSTDYVFSGEKSSPYVETDEVKSINVYGESKWLGEEAVRASCPKHIILRVSWVFGFYGNNFVKTIQRLSREREELRVVDDQLGAPTSTENISKVLLRICEQMQNPDFDAFGTYHYCDEPATNWFEFAEASVAETRQYEALAVKRIIPITTEQFPTPAKRQQNSRMDCNKLKNQFGIEQYSWQMALKKMIKDIHDS
jgi:dTDP-4-dehydrorhamnose reductase